MGNLRLLPCDPSDAPEILAGQFAAFGDPHEEFFFVLFPKDEAREKAVKRMVDWWLGDESAKYMKVVDEETGKFGIRLVASLYLLCPSRWLSILYMKRAGMIGCC